MLASPRKEEAIRLAFHARVEIGLVATLMLARCKGDIDDRIDVADVNARNSLYKVEQLESRVSDIDSRLNM